MAQPLPFAHDLAADGCDARITGRVIVVLFSTRDCPYCRQVRDGYLAPLAAHSDAAVRVLERRIEAGCAAA